MRHPGKYPCELSYPLAGTSVSTQTHYAVPRGKHQGSQREGMRDAPLGNCACQPASVFSKIAAGAAAAAAAGFV